jgi:hypothetical protein
MHHGKASAENMDAREATALDDFTAALGFQEGESQQHDHARAKLERVGNKLLGRLERRVRDDAFAPRGRFRFHVLETEQLFDVAKNLIHASRYLVGLPHSVTLAAA